MALHALRYIKFARCNYLCLPGYWDGCACSGHPLGIVLTPITIIIIIKIINNEYQSITTTIASALPSVSAHSGTNVT